MWPALSFADQLTLARLFAGFPLLALSALEGEGVRPLSFLLFAVAALTDYWDGRLARQSGQTSALGAALDPVADKALVTGAFLALMLTDSLGWFGGLLALSILVRDLVVGGLRSLGGAASLPVSRLAKAKTSLLLVALGLLLLNLPILNILGWLGFVGAAALSLWTGMSYLRFALQPR